MKKNRGVKFLIMLAMFVVAIVSFAGFKTLASAAGGIYQGGGTLELRGGTINSEVYVYSGTCNYYDATFGSNGYIYLTSGCYVTIKQAPTRDIKIQLASTANGTKVATLSGVSATTTTLGYIKVTNLPSYMELVYSGNDVLAKYKNYTVTLSRNYSSYGTLSTDSVSVPYNTTYSVSGNKLVFSNGTEVTPSPATQTSQYTYSFSSWSSTSGTITGDTTITARFSRSTRYYTVTLSRNNSTYGTLSTYSVSVAYGTTYSVSGNKLVFSSGTEVTPTPATQTTEYTYSFSSWSSTSGTITAAKTITANFSRDPRYYTVTFSVNNSSYGHMSETSISVPYGATYSSSGVKMTFNYGGSEVASVYAYSTSNTSSYAYSFSSFSPSSGTIKGNTSITASFTRNSALTMTVNAGRNGKSTIYVKYGESYDARTATLKFGDGQSVTARPQANTLTFSYWSDANSNKISTTGYVYSNSTFKAQFDLQMFLPNYDNDGVKTHQYKTASWQGSITAVKTEDMRASIDTGSWLKTIVLDTPSCDILKFKKPI